MTNFVLKLDEYGVPQPVVIETKTLSNGESVSATYNGVKYLETKMQVLERLATELTEKNFDVEEFIQRQARVQNTWNEARLKEIGQEEYDNETDLVGGPCPTCDRRMSSLRLLLCEYLVCYHCKTSSVWMSGNLCDDPDDEQAIRLYVLSKLRKTS